MMRIVSLSKTPLAELVPPSAPPCPASSTNTGVKGKDSSLGALTAALFPACRTEISVITAKHKPTQDKIHRLRKKIIINIAPFGAIYEDISISMRIIAQMFLKGNPLFFLKMVHYCQMSTKTV